MISIVTPTYNRVLKVSRSISSSLRLIKTIGGELIVIDDASTDDTLKMIKIHYSDEIKSGLLKVFALNENLGVTGAKNYGATKAEFDWVVFMDSDDCFLDCVGDDLKFELKRLSQFDLLFFRCMDLESKELIGASCKAYELTFRDFLNEGTPGECLPIVRRDVIAKFPYPEDLRGGESLSYKDMLFSGVKGYVSSLVVRLYDSSGDDRLSLLSSRIKRSRGLFKYHLRDFKYFSKLTVKKKIFLFLRLLKYFFLILVFYVFK